MIPLKLFMCILQQRGSKIYPHFLLTTGGGFADTCWYQDTYLYWCEKHFLEKIHLRSKKRRNPRKAYADGFTQGNLMWAQSICSEKRTAEENGIIQDFACCHGWHTLIWVTAKHKCDISGTLRAHLESTISAAFWRGFGKSSWKIWDLEHQCKQVDLFLLFCNFVW